MFLSLPCKALPAFSVHLCLSVSRHKAASGLNTTWWSLNQNLEQTFSWWLLVFCDSTPSYLGTWQIDQAASDSNSPGSTGIKGVSTMSGLQDCLYLVLFYFWRWLPTAHLLVHVKLIMCKASPVSTVPCSPCPTPSYTSPLSSII